MRKYILVGILLLALCTVYGFFYHKAKKNYNKSIINEGMSMSKLKVDHLIDVHYYEEYGEYPLDIDFDDDIFMKYDTTFVEDNFLMVGFAHRDWFSDNEDDNLIYYPLYNRYTKKRDGFIILSRGFDKKLDNVFDYTDTLYVDSWWRYVKLYNLTDYLEANYKYDLAVSFIEPLDSNFPEDLVPEDAFPRFSFFKSLLGDKDFLISVKNKR